MKQQLTEVQRLQKIAGILKEGIEHVPDEIKSFAKRKGISSLVNNVANWAAKSGEKIIGGSVIGKNQSILTLDLTNQGGEIDIYIDNKNVELYGEPVSDAKSFAKVLAHYKYDKENIEGQ
jgi:hypothetical protein